METETWIEMISPFVANAHGCNKLKLVLSLIEFCDLERKTLLIAKFLGRLAFIGLALVQPQERYSPELALLQMPA